MTSCCEKSSLHLVLCETNIDNRKWQNWRTELGFNGGIVLNSRGRSGGLILFWKQPVVVSVKSLSQGHIDCIINSLGKVWRFTGFYDNSDTSLWVFSWDLIRRLKKI